MSNRPVLASGPTASNTIQTLEQELPFIKFPPFPEPPPGVTIMSFMEFKPRGIQLFSEPKKGGNDGGDEDVELDALGIPTVELRIKHATDECKSNTRKKRKKKKAAAATEAGAAPVKKLPWYEEWEEGEDLRVTKMWYDANISPADRFYQASFDFRTGRPWPAVSSGLNNLWDQFRLFTGLLVNPSVYRKASAKNLPRAESPDFDSDDEDDPVMNIGDGGGDSRPAKRQRSGEAPNLGDDDNDDDPQKMDEEIREEKISIFLSNPEKAVRIFLSSFMRERGLIWAERNLIHTPRLVSFFLAFVLRNGVLSEPVYRRGLKQALETIELAKRELPLTYTVGQSIPDAFNEGCRECFGRQGGINWSVVNVTTTTTEKKDAAITVTDIDGAKTDVALPTETQMLVKDAIEDNVDMEVSIDTAATVVKNPADENPTSWEGWAEDDNTWAQGISWGNSAQDSQGMNGGVGADAQWTDPNPSWMCDLKSLFPLLGPSVFPLTHTTGIVECSTRRVSAIHFPSNHPKGAPSSSRKPKKAKAKGHEGQGWTPSADGVEAEFDARFAKVILEPWGREEGDILAPEIWSTSRGPVIDPANPSIVLGDPSGTATRKPHNPIKDNITLLVQPSFAETLELAKGFGLGAMWIELVRQKPGAEVDADGEPAPIDTSTAGRYWYHEDVTGIFPSFYTPGEKDQGGD